jgi:penicillin-binding protein 1A
VARIFRTLFNLFLIALVAVLVLVTALYFYVMREYQGRLDETYPALVENSYVYDREGEMIAEFPAEEDRKTVGFDGLGERLPQAVIAIEDRRYYEHVGVDFEGVGRAAWADLRAWRVEEGGSTITEQLMKNLYIPDEARLEVSFWRRFTQAAIAFAYERNHTKEQVLTSYLNTVYFGDGAYGAEIAAQRYFGKSARDLSLSEAAALAGFLHAPSTYLPEEEGIGRATERRDEVLDRMLEQNMISPEQHDAASAQPVEFASPSEPDDPLFEPFIDKVRREVEDELGPEALQKGGLRIETTMDPGMQRAAVETTDEVLYAESDPSGAIATVQPQSGAIRVMAGQKDDFNLALDARRQPGSSFKAMVLAEAMRRDVSPQITYPSQELNVRFQGGDYTIANYDHIERGNITLVEATAESDNTVYVQLAVDLGLENVVETAQDMGITAEMDAYPSTAIGGLRSGVSPLHMASAYATFAGGGIYREPYSIERIEKTSYGKGENVYDHRDLGRRVLTGNEAAAATEVLRGVVKDGTASRFHNLDREIGRPSAGKTGTTDDFADAWYVGYTARLSTAVWIGYPESRRSMVAVHGLPEVNGETLPLDLWSAYMARATEGDPPIDFPEPDWTEFEVRYP